MREAEPQRKIIRENFGPGQFGELAFQTILKGATCAAFIGENGEFCTRISDRTVDFDVLGNAEFLPTCSDEHEQLVKETIVQEARQNDRWVTPDFSRNGFGRGDVVPLNRQ